MIEKVDPALLAGLRAVAGAPPNPAAYSPPTLPPATHTAEVNSMPITGFAGGFGLGPTNTRLNEPPVERLPPVPSQWVTQGGLVYPAPQERSNGQLQAALAKAQGQMHNAPFDAKNPHYGNRYATLASICNTVRKALSDNGICVTQTIHEKGTILRTTLGKDGQEMTSEYPLVFTGEDQKFGSRLTYAKRYSLSSFCCVAADEDDDAEAAGKVDNRPVTPEQVEHLQMLLDELEVGTEARLLAYQSKDSKRDIKRLEDIWQSEFPKVFAVLEKKRTGKTPPKEPPK